MSERREIALMIGGVALVAIGVGLMVGPLFWALLVFVFTKASPFEALLILGFLLAMAGMMIATVPLATKPLTMPVAPELPPWLTEKLNKHEGKA